MNSNPSHTPYMQRAIDLAKKGLGTVSPNPLVGAVLVYGEQIIGEGYHAQYGEGHAEVNCLQNVSAENNQYIPLATLYVTLEPCSHFGKTPPCVDLILKNEIKKVVIGHVDPFEKVDGSGIQKLREAGVEVVVGVLENDSSWMNRRFLCFHTQKRPYLILKWAQSQDGFIAPKNDDQYWLSSHTSKTLVHQWRAEEDAILVGYNTVLKDNPMLTTRLVEGKNPIRIIIDRNRELPTDKGVFDTSAPTLFFNHTSHGKIAENEFIQLDFTKNIIQQLLAELYKRSIQSVLIEGGRKTLDLFIKNGLWDEARVFTAPKKLEDGLKAPILYISPSETVLSGADELAFYYPQK